MGPRLNEWTLNLSKFDVMRHGIQESDGLEFVSEQNQLD